MRRDLALRGSRSTCACSADISTRASYALAVLRARAAARRTRPARASATPAPARSSQERRTREERKTITVVFVDLVGFTARAEQLDPEDVRARALAVPRARPRRARAARRHGREVHRRRGDGRLRRAGGARGRSGARRRAALAIRDWSAEQPDARRSGSRSTPARRSSTVGARPAEGEAMVAGDVVNTAARMQAAAPVERRPRRRDDLPGDPRRDPLPRGRSRSRRRARPSRCAVWEAVEAVGRASVSTSSERAGTPLVGRDREVELAALAARRACARSARRSS